ncbi:hypothetical protein [Rhizobium sp. TRM95796]|uniref:hypothetical protein n=1 Tax=Rhizobium sp. TRM95796 TaxID=2979862 RepID=UPI0021E702BE|nr:hypothetical protein [Rhizobium sp. TRM95796]MCV3765143.1 hypothetical protein [Rhizobium sp. TRM95796]
MKVSAKVSGRVQSEVSAADAEIISASKPNRKKKSPSSGRYLVRNGNSLLFQIRMPKSLVSKGNGLLRLSLGPMPLAKARALADELAGIARKAFRDLERIMNDDDNIDHEEDSEESRKRKMAALFGLDGADDERLTIQVMTAHMKAALYDMHQPGAPLSPQEAQGHEMIRNLVSITREVTAKREGREHSPLIADNADLLASTYISKWQTSTAAPDNPLAPTAASMLSPAAGAPSQTNSSPGPIVTVPPPIQVPPLVSGASPPEPQYREEDDEEIAAYHLDRRVARRAHSTRPKFSVVARKYFAARRLKDSDRTNDIEIAEARVELFLDLIGDHPVDTYNGTDLQAFIEFLRYWPSKKSDRPKDMSPREIVEFNKDLHLVPLSRSTLEDGYIAVVKSVINSAQTEMDFVSKFRTARLIYPSTARSKTHSEPLGSDKISKLFAAGVATGYIDEAMLPPLALLTGRRLSLLSYLIGDDFREKFTGVWVAQTSGIVYVNGRLTRVPYKTDASTEYFVLHRFLVEIGFVEWAMSRGQDFIFPQIMKSEDPSKRASQIMQRLFKRAGIKGARGEVFHSLRGAYINESTEQKVDRRERKQQVGHELGEDEHEMYGFSSLTEKQARRLAHLELSAEIDFSVFRGLDFEKMAAKERKKGRRAFED